MFGFGEINSLRRCFHPHRRHWYVVFVKFGVLFLRILVCFLYEKVFLRRVVWQAHIAKKESIVGENRFVEEKYNAMKQSSK